MTLIELASLFEERKSWLVTASDLGKDALHIYFGLALFMLVRLAWRWRGGWVAAWLAVLDGRALPPPSARQRWVAREGD